MPLRISDIQKIRKAVHDVADVRVYEHRGHVVPLTAIDPASQALIARFSESDAELVPVITDGKPTVMRMTAWMAHEGVNDNGLAFVREELPAAAERISQDNPLVCDFNHAAVKGGEFPIIGMWHKAAYAFDAAANKWGIITTGVMFAWLFPEIAQAMLADQARNGHLRYSMACIGDSYEYSNLAGRSIQIAHNPVFFTNSLLDVTPADPAAIGHVALAGDPVPPPGPVGTPVLHDPKNKTPVDPNVDPENPIPPSGSDGSLPVNALLAELQALVATWGLPNRQLPINEIPGPTPQEKKAMEDLQAKINELIPKLAENEQLRSANADLTAKLALLQEQVKNLQTYEATALDLKLTKETLQGEYDVVLAENTALKAANAELTAKVDAFEADRSATEKAAQLAARVAELPDAVRAAHAKSSDDVRAKREANWASKTPEEWEFYKAEELSIAPAVKIGYLQRSDAQGALPNSPPDGDPLAAMLARVKK